MAVDNLRLQPIRRHRKRPQPNPNRIEDRVSNRRRKPYDRSLSCACRGQVLAIDQNRFDQRNVAEARDSVSREPAVHDLAIIEVNRFKQRASDSHHD